MIEIKITGYSLQECLDQIKGVSFTAEVKAEEATTKPAEMPTEAPVEPMAKEVPATEQKPAEPAKKATKKAEEPAKKEEPEEPVKAEEPVKPVEITRDMAWEIATRVKNEVSLGALRLILSEFNAQKFAQLNPRDYEMFFLACKARIEEGK